MNVLVELEVFLVGVVVKVVAVVVVVVVVDAVVGVVVVEAVVVVANPRLKNQIEISGVLLAQVISACNGPALQSGDSCAATCNDGFVGAPTVACTSAGTYTAIVSEQCTFNNSEQRLLQQCMISALQPACC